MESLESDKAGKLESENAVCNGWHAFSLSYCGGLPCEQDFSHKDISCQLFVAFRSRS
jgi:hypothetical protein